MQYGDIEDSVVSSCCHMPSAICLGLGVVWSNLSCICGISWLAGKLPAEISVSTQVLRKPDGMSRGFGFITFKDEMSVEKCLVKQHTLNGKQVGSKREARCTL